MPNRHLSLGVECKQLKFRILLINCCLVVRGSLVVHVRLFFRTCEVLNEKRKNKKTKTDHGHFTGHAPQALHWPLIHGHLKAANENAESTHRKFSAAI